MKKAKENSGKLKIPMEFEVAVSSFLKVKPEPKHKEKRGQTDKACPRKG